VLAAADGGGVGDEGGLGDEAEPAGEEVAVSPEAAVAEAFVGNPALLIKVCKSVFEFLSLSGSLGILNWGRLKALLRRRTHNTTPHLSNSSKDGPPAATTVSIPSIEGRTMGPTAVVKQ
jgi:hypothetical protein